MGFCLSKKGNTFHLRVYVPQELQNILGRKELKKSLKTPKRSEAKVLASPMIYKTLTAFLRIQTGMLTAGQLKQITGKILAEFGRKTEGHRSDLKDSFDFLGAVPLGLNPNSADLALIDSAYAKRKTPEDIGLAVAGYETRIDYLQQELSTLSFSDETYRLVQQLIEQDNLQIDSPSPAWFDPNGDERHNEVPDDFIKVCKAVVKGLIDAFSLEVMRLQGKTDRALEVDILTRIEDSTPKPKLSDLWAAYKNLKITTRKWTDKTASGYARFYTDVVEIIGNKELAEYTTTDALELVKALQVGNKGSTITGKIEFVSSMFKFALKTPETIDTWKVRGNPFTEMQVQSNGETARKVEYSQDELVSLLTGLLKVRKLVEPHRFWVPLVALYTGMRQNEICQLRIADIEVDSGILVFRICHNPAIQQRTKARKTRTCPVHPMLAKLGFLDYVERLKAAKHDRVFPTLTHTSGKDWTGKVRGWWNESYQQMHVADTIGKSFHSLRKNFIDWYKQNKMYDSASDRAVVQSMVGHDEDDVTGKHYEQTFQPKTQMHMLRKLNYGFEADLIEALRKKEY